MFSNEYLKSERDYERQAAIAAATPSVKDIRGDARTQRLAATQVGRIRTATMQSMINRASMNMALNKPTIKKVGRIASLLSKIPILPAPVKIGLKVVGITAGVAATGKLPGVSSVAGSIAKSVATSALTDRLLKGRSNDEEAKRAVRMAAIRQRRDDAIEKDEDAEFEWVTQNDSKVRDEHSPLHGQVFRWDTGYGGKYPGDDYGCRCTARDIDNEII